MNIKKIKNAFGIFCLSLISLFAIDVNAAEIVYDGNKFASAYDGKTFESRTKEQIATEYKNVEKSYGTFIDRKYETYYSVPYSTKVPFAAGKLTDDTHRAMTNYTNFYRYLVGSRKLNGVSTHYDDLQAGALVRNYDFAHYNLSYSAKPAGMSDALWNLGANARNNIIASGPTPLGSIDMWINEGYYYYGDAFDPNETGHRSALISPKRKHLDFGYADRLAIGRHESDYGYVDSKAFTAFPAPGYFPNNVVDSYRSAWSIEFNSSRINLTDHIKAVVTNLKTNESYTCETGTCLKVDKYDKNAILFKQPKPSYKGTYVVGDRYRVEVTGITDKSGNAVKAVYETEFFDLDNIDTDSKDIITEVKLVNPSKMTYLNSELNHDDLKNSLDFTGGKIVVTFGDYSKKEINLDKTMISDIFDFTYGSGLIRVKFKYEDYSDSIYVTYVVLDDVSKRYTTYGKTLSDLDLPMSSYGTYTWVDGNNASVGNAGEKTFNLKFTPNDSYKNIYGEKVFPAKVVVNKAMPEYKLPGKLRGDCGSTLGDIELPDGFEWTVPFIKLDKEGISEYYVKYVPKDTDNYEIVYGLKVKVEVTKETPDYTIPTGLTAKYGDTLASVKLPVVDNGKFTFNDALSTSVGNAGKHEFIVTFTPNDLDKYRVVNDIKVSIDVAKIEIKDFVIPTVAEMSYDPNKTLGKISLGDRWTWDNPNVVPQVGNAGYKATYTPVDAINYDYSKFDLNPTIQVKVNKIVAPDVSLEFTRFSYSKKTLADVELPTSEYGKYVWNDSIDTVLEKGTREFLVTFKPNDARNYETITDIAVTIEVDKEKPKFDVPTNLVATYEDLLSSISLPHGFSWSEQYNENTLVGNAGKNKFYLTFTPDDTENFATVKGIEVLVEVKKKKAELVEVPVIDSEFTYSPNRKLGDITLPSGWTWDDSSIVPTVGNEGYKITYKPTDDKNYDYSEQNLNPTIVVKVNKATYPFESKLPEFVTVEWNTDFSDVDLPEGFSFQETGKVGEIGSYEYLVTYTPSDLNNYNISKDIILKVNVCKRVPDVTIDREMTIDKKDGMLLKDIKLPKGWAWNSPEKVVTNGIFWVSYTPEDNVHYSVINTTIRINLKEEIVNNIGSQLANNDSSLTLPASKDNDKSLASSDKDDKKSNKVEKDDEDDENLDEEDDDDYVDEENSRKFPWWILILMIIGVGAIIGYNIMKDED